VCGGEKMNNYSSNHFIVMFVACAVIIVGLMLLIRFFIKNFGINSGNAPYMNAKKILKVKDEENVIGYILKPDATLETQLAGLDKLTKPESFIQIASEAQNDALFHAALERVSDDAGLCSVLLAYNHNQDRAQAVLGKIKNRNTINEAAVKGSVHAIEIVTDPDILIQAAIAGSEEAQKKIKGDQKLSAIYTKTRNKDIKKSAFNRISDEDLKAQISEQYAKSIAYWLIKHKAQPELKELVELIEVVIDNKDLREGETKEILWRSAANRLSGIASGYFEQDPEILYPIWDELKNTIESTKVEKHSVSYALKGNLMAPKDVRWKENAGRHFPDKPDGVS